MNRLLLFILRSQSPYTSSISQSILKGIKNLFTTCFRPSGKTTFIGYIISFGFALTFLKNAICDCSFKWSISNRFPYALVFRDLEGARSIGIEIFRRTRGEAMVLFSFDVVDSRVYARRFLSWRFCWLVDWRQNFSRHFSPNGYKNSRLITE